MRADRLLSLILLLHARGRMTAEALARHLEVSERTIYRDLDALSTAGIPVYTQSGANGGVFLDENYRLSLTGLSRSEVRSLFVSSEAGPLKDLGLGKAVEDTLLKIFAALPNQQRSEVELMRQRFHIDPANWFQIVEPTPFLALLQQAVWEDRQVRITYRPVAGEVNERVIDAYALVAKANIWYLVGKKPDGEMHNYRVVRFKNVEMLERRFIRDPDFDLAAYWKESCEKFERASLEMSPPYHTLLRVHPSMLWYFPGYMEGRYEQVGAQDENGWYTLRVTFTDQAEARSRLMGLGTKVLVVEPLELRDAILETARAILDFHERMPHE
ncbi:MAG TPA: WYL domain-containing protein [Oceanobacillus sp.]|nr:WYL domain-containing protein [Oceanobacillus sp.]